MRAVWSHCSQNIRHDLTLFRPLKDLFTALKRISAFILTGTGIAMKLVVDFRVLKPRAAKTKGEILRRKGMPFWNDPHRVLMNRGDVD